MYISPSNHRLGFCSRDSIIVKLRLLKSFQPKSAPSLPITTSPTAGILHHAPAISPWIFDNELTTCKYIIGCDAFRNSLGETNQSTKVSRVRVGKNKGSSDGLSPHSVANDFVAYDIVPLNKV